MRRTALIRMMLVAMVGATVALVGCNPSTEAPPATTSQVSTQAKATAVAMATASPTPRATATPSPTPAQAPPATANATPAQAADVAPENFRVRFETTKGTFVAEFHKAWAPIGVQRVYELARANFFDGAKLFRVLPTFVVQFGIAGDPQLNAQWNTRNLRDDPVTHSNTAGTITFTSGGPQFPNTRTTQLFISVANNASQLDAMGFAPIGEVVEGMDVVRSLYSGYGERASNQQGLIQTRGNAFLEAQYPLLDAIEHAELVTTGESNAGAQ